MLNFFKHSYLSQQIAVVVIALVLWLPAFITKSAFVPSEFNTPLYNIVVSLLDFSPFMLNALAFIVYLLSVFLFNSVLSANRLVSKYSTVGAFCFVLMMCCSPELHACYPFIFACPFILMAMHTLFLIYQTDAPENYMMNIGYFIGIASLFYYPSIFLILWVMISFMMFRLNEIRYMLIPVTGFMIVNALVVGISFMTGKYEVLIDSYSHFFNNISFSFEMTAGNKILLLVTVLLFLFSLMRNASSRNSERGTNIRKREGSSLLLALFASIIFFIQKPLVNNALIFMMFAFFYAITLSDIKKSKLASITMALVLTYILANQYLPLFGIGL
ncbi:MAG: hypothetical protein IKW51_01260 [Bacteroidales bacterium]|nr:hypothetical protein [Bacteroidales bacterium]